MVIVGYRYVSPKPGKDYSVVIRSALDQLSRDTPSFRRFIRRYARTIEDYGDELVKKLSPEFDAKGELLPSDIKKLEEYIRTIRTEMVAKLEKEYTEEFGDPSAKGIKMYGHGEKFVIYGNFTTALRKKMAQEYDLYTTGSDENPFKSEPKNMYVTPDVHVALRFLKRFPKLTATSRSFPGHNLWYKDRSEDELELCGEPTEDERAVFLSYDWKLDETQKCHIFNKSQLKSVEKIFPGIQKQ